MAVAATASEQLGHFRVDFSVLGDVVTGGAMGYGASGGSAEGVMQTQGDGLLGGLGVNPAGYIALVELFEAPGVKSADGGRHSVV